MPNGAGRVADDALGLAPEDLENSEGDPIALLRHRTALLERANRQLEAFAYTVSHDLRAPLRAIDGFSRLLAEEIGPDPSPDALHYLEVILQNVTKMRQQIDDVLSFSRLGRAALSIEAVDLTEVAAGVLHDLEQEADGRTVEVYLGTLPVVQADRSQMRLLFQNLISNAFKYTQPRESARVVIDADGDVVFVRDNGVGFDMRHADRLFVVFQRMHRPEEFEGTGAGLAIAQQIVARHGGRIWAEAKVDEGATFYFEVGDAR